MLPVRAEGLKIAANARVLSVCSDSRVRKLGKNKKKMTIAIIEKDSNITADGTKIAGVKI